MPYKPLEPKPNFVDLEKEIQEYWQKNQIFRQSLKNREGSESFVFFDGPPTANGSPGLHHVLVRAFKDAVCRFQTMQGKYVARKAGWDTHGLPVELQVEKQLGISGKQDIENIVEGDKHASILKFNELCRESVWRYKNDWEKLTQRMAYWVDMDDPYITYDPKYIESVWWAIKQLWDKDLVYEGHRVTPYCPRCGTGLSSHEVAQGYEDVTETSVFVKFKLNSDLPGYEGKDVFVLAWTTTPWTLPGNLALAVGADITYGIYLDSQTGEYLIVARELADKVLAGFEVELKGEVKGADLAGQSYDSLFPGAVPEDALNDKAFKIYEADFVTTQDGTGVVHTAVMYGEDDYQLGERVGLPKFHTVDERGHFGQSVPEVGGMFVKKKSTEEKIFTFLKDRGLLLRTEDYTHSYPFCWRCKTALLYYARRSWYIRMSSLREELLENNSRINWEPDHIKNGRFGEWLQEVKDWAISRERYWGTPLPFWRCTDCEDVTVVGSYKDLQIEPSTNTFYIMRHGHSEKNALGVISSYPEIKSYKLTEDGLGSAGMAAKDLQEVGGVDVIYASDLERTRQTAQIVADELGVEVKFDERLREISYGTLNGLSVSEYIQIKTDGSVPEDHESEASVANRMIDFIRDIDGKYQGKKVLIVSHGDPIWLLKQHCNLKNASYPDYARAELLENVRSVDPHRPYIDAVELKCGKCGGQARRVPEVLDVWFDSGAMPYAQYHYPFENQELIDSGAQFPADYICEAVDQTRGWFYTMLAVSTALGRGPAYKQANSLGHILDDKGQKMSKSKGNIVNPWEVFDAFGADTLRWHLFTVNQAGESKLFNSDDLAVTQRKVFNIVANVYNYFATYANAQGWEYDSESHGNTINSPIVLDQWINARFHSTVQAVAENTEELNLFKAVRSVEDYVADLSTWYLRRSRGREDKHFLPTLFYNLIWLSRVMAPFAPFTAERLYQSLNLNSPDYPESVHMTDWPENVELTLEEDELLRSMEQVRTAAELGNSIRKTEGVKLRQPLSAVYVTSAEKEVSWSEDLKSVLLDELNIKEFRKTDSMVWKDAGTVKVGLDLNMTPELQSEGDARELERAIQSLRKELGMKVGEPAKLFYELSDDAAALLEMLDYKKLSIDQKVSGKSDAAASTEVKLSLGNAWVGLDK